MIEELYPGAIRCLRRARERKRELADQWSAVLDAESLETVVRTHENGTGEIRVSIDWPAESRARATRAFAECLAELWAALDSLVAETVTIFSVLQTPRDPGRARYFPVADTSEGFQGLLDLSCLDGVLQRHFEIVRSTQPWRGDLGIDEPDRLRAGLRQLLDWTAAIEADELVTAWASPVEPEVRAAPPAKVTRIATESPSEVTSNGTLVATFTIDGYESGTDVSGASGAFIDLGFLATNRPANKDSTFEMALNEVLDVVWLYAAHFADATAQVNVPRRVLPGPSQDGELWLEATSTNRGWEPAHLAAVRDSETGVGVIVDETAEELTVVVSTESGVFERRIPTASPLRSAQSIGLAAEQATRDAVATWGLPDFVMRPLVERKGPGVREISDGLIVVGDLGAIIQVKSRGAAPGDVEKEARWVTKNISGACRQIDGTFRRLSNLVVTMVNGRNRNVRIDGATIRWIGIVIVEHSAPPAGLDTSFAVAKVPVAVLLRRDWEFLFGQLKSTRAVLEYVDRVGSSSPLGEEPYRYFELANLDAVAPPGSPNPLLTGLGKVQTIPVLPTAPAGYNNPRAFAMVRRICEEIAGISDAKVSEEDRLQVLADIDGLPVGHRESLGSLMLDELDEVVRNPPSGVRWKFRTYLPRVTGATQVGFGICSVHNESVQNAFGVWVQLRHHERGDREDLNVIRSIGVMLTPRPDGKRDWDTTLFVVSGDLMLTPEEVAGFAKVWGRRGDPKLEG